MSNPRKFSEKIAMHAQKQAEGTAAFEAILKEVSATTRAAMVKKSANFQTPLTTSSQPTFLPTTTDQQPCRLPVASTQYLVDQRSSVVYRGRSLPNVNQMASHKPIDLQKALSSLENMKHEAMGRSTSTSGRCVEKFFPRGQMERSSSQPRKHFSLTRHRDCSPYGSVYLSPPNDPSWRRVSSDSAIHNNMLGNQSQCRSKIILNTEHVGSSDNITVSFAGFQKQPCSTQFWQVPEDAVCGRPKSCDVPGISIFPSSEIQNTGGVAIAIAMQQTPSTPSGGSLPNLNKNPVQAGSCNSNIIEKEPSGDGIAQYYLQQPRLQRHTIPAPLVLKDSNFIVMDTNSLMCDNTMLLRGPTQHSSSVNCQYSSNSPSLVITNENSPNQLTPNMNSQQLLQYHQQQQQQLIIQHCQLLQHHDTQQKHQVIANQSSGSLGQSTMASLSSPIQVTPSTNYPQQLLQAVLTQGLNIQQLGGQQQVSQETDYGSFSFSPDSAFQLNNQQSLKGHFFPIHNLNTKQSGNTPTHVILSSNVLADAAAKQQAAVAAAVAQSNSLSSAKRLSFANIMPVTDNSKSQKIIYNSNEHQQSHTNVLQQKFQQISVGKNLSLDYTLDGITLQPLSPPLANFVLVQNNDLSNWIPQTFVASPNNNTCSHDIVMLDNELVHDNSSIIHQQQTASTLKVIPDIIFTDFVSSPQERFHNPQQNSQQMQSPDDCKDALNALSYLSDAFEGEIFTSEDAFKLALDPLEMEELQMLADSSVFTDPATEDSFRLDRP